MKYQRLWAEQDLTNKLKEIAVLCHERQQNIMDDAEYVAHYQTNRITVFKRYPKEWDKFFKEEVETFKTQDLSVIQRPTDTQGE